MSKEARQFVFIMLKPSAANNIRLTNFIKNELLKYGEIKYIKNSVIVKKQTISDHYQASKTSLWYPALINYFNDKTVIHFILEATPKKTYFLPDGEDFATFLRQKVIGPANVFKTKKFHIRRLAFKNFPSCLLDNLIHCSDNIKESLKEIRIWYKDEPLVIEEFETKALALIQVKDQAKC